MMIYVAARAHKASVNDGVGIFYHCIRKNGITHATVIILNIKFYLFSTISTSSFLSKILILRHGIFLLNMVLCQCSFANTLLF